MKTKFRFLIDQNVSPKTVAFLRSLDLDIISVEETLTNYTDDAVIALARTQNLVFVTYDMHVPLSIQSKREKVPGLILLRVHPQTIEILHKALQVFFDKLNFDELSANLIIVDNKNYQVMPMMNLVQQQ